MTDDEAETESEPEEDAGIWARTTAPQSPYTLGQVGTGFVVLAIGLAIGFGLPLLGGFGRRRHVQDRRFDSLPDDGGQVGPGGAGQAGDGQRAAARGDFLNQA